VWHLASYLIGVNGPPFVRVKGVSITNQFGDLTVNLIKPGRLFVPSLKNGTPAGPGMPDHFTCYNVDRTQGTPAFTPVKGVSIVTQFESATIDVISPLRLCVPTDKNDEGILIPPTTSCATRLGERDRSAAQGDDRQPVRAAGVLHQPAARLCVPSR
jgi:hypothetical protein